MARSPRFFVDGFPPHVVQRGNNRQRVFCNDGDYHYFRRQLQTAAARHGVRIHAHVLMPNHFHLLATPDSAHSLPKLVQTIGRRYVGRFNALYRRTGTLWDGRYRATLVDTDRYLLACMRYIELNPVRASLVRNARDYPWSSFGANAFGAPDSIVEPHSRYAQLGQGDDARLRAYRSQFEVGLSDADLSAIRDSTQYAWALGDECFLARIQEKIGRRAARARHRARPATETPSLKVSDPNP